MQKAAAVLVVASLIMLIFVGFESSEAEEPGAGASDVVGEYHRFGSDEDLTAEHVSWTGGLMEVEAPVFTSSLQIDVTFLDKELGSWGSHQEFSLGDGFVEFENRMVTFEALDLGEEPIFTIGARDQIKFQDRPMWVSVEQTGPEEKLTLEMDDGDTTGQQIFIAKEWLWDRGIHRPVVMHEDGTNLTVERVPGGNGWMIDVHHFTYVEITATDMIVFSRQDDIIVPHTDKTRWYPDEKRLEIDVGNECAAYIITDPSLECDSIDQDIMVDKDWLDMRIDYLALENHTWGVEKYNLRGAGQEEYYEVALAASQIPTTVIYNEFNPTDIPTYTYGNPETIMSHSFNESMRLEQGPMQISTIVNGTGLSVNVHNSFLPRDLFINATFLAGLGLSAPHAVNPLNNDSYVHSYFTYDNEGIIVEISDHSTHILGNATLIAQESRQRFSVLGYNETRHELDVYLPLYTPYLDHGFNIEINNLPWRENVGIPAYELKSVGLSVNGELIAARNLTHFNDGTPTPGGFTRFSISALESEISHMNITFWSNEDQSSGPEETFPLVNEILTTSPDEAGLASEILEGECNALPEVETDPEGRSYRRGLDEATADEDWIGGRAVKFTTTYGCPSVGSRTIDYYWGYDGFGKSEIHGSGSWFNDHGSPIEGTRELGHPTYRHSVAISAPAVGMLEPQSTGGPAEAKFSRIAVMAEYWADLSDCPSYKDTLVKNAIAWIIGQVPIVGGASILVPDKKCYLSLSPYVDSHPNEPEWKAIGGRINSAESTGNVEEEGGPGSAVGFFGIWDFSAPVDTITFFDTGHVATIEVTQFYQVCDGSVPGTGCRQTAKTSNWVSIQTGTVLKMVRES